MEADVFCQNRGARLPTEAEWEYAARGPDGLVYPWGNDFVADNVLCTSDCSDPTWDVGSKPGGVSWIGAYDLSGNVWEWVSDWSGTYPLELQVNAVGPDSGEYRVLRGGSWAVNGDVLRSAYRYWDDPDYGFMDYGFRCGGDISILP